MRLTPTSSSEKRTTRIAEKRIRDLQDQTTTILLHVESRWPKAVTSNVDAELPGSTLVGFCLYEEEVEKARINGASEPT